MDPSNNSLHWIAAYGVWLPVAFFVVLTIVLATFSSKPAVSFRRGGYFVLALAFCTLLFSSVSRDARHVLMVSLVLFMVVTGFVRYYRSTPLERKFGSLAPMMAAHRNGDFELALRLCESLSSRRIPEANADLLRSAALFQLRRLDEAESLLQGALGKRPSRETEALIHSQLGQVFKEEGRREDAIRSFQRSQELSPKRGGAFHSEAEIYLNGKCEPRKALELAQHAVELDRQQPAERQALSLSSSLAALAWALAANGRTVEARESVREALEQTQQDSVPRVAEDYYIAGRAMLAAGDQSVATQFFRKVADLDTKGNFGYLARRELAALR
jgi:tetratricopeptide (TPR) repeat protein